LAGVCDGQLEPPVILLKNELTIFQKFCYCRDSLLFVGRSGYFLSGENNDYANNQSAHPNGQGKQERQVYGAGAQVLPAKTRGLHEGLYDHAQEAELRFA
jgi:hypothetical protein